jgi:ubiquinone/menaquinone biosynthesis C-methylase UbiE
MELEQLKKNWEELGDSDPYWAVLSNPSKINNKWDLEEFYETGRHWVDNTFVSLNLNNSINRDNALDFGCGPGRLTQALCGKFKNVTGIDISSSMIKLAREHNKFPESCKYLVNSSNDLSQLASNRFDFILSFFTLQHVKKQLVLNYIIEFSRVVKPEGVVLFNVPHTPPRILKILSIVIGRRGVNLVRRLYYRKNAVIEMHWIKEAWLLDFINNNGFEVLRINDDKSVGPKWGSNLYLLKKLPATNQ